MTETLSASYQNDRAISMAKRLADQVRERGIRSGLLAVRIARHVDPQVKVGDRMVIAGAEFVVSP